jgi:prepilin-type N-terminal cleavage/methylation domain-containing protein
MIYNNQGGEAMFHNKDGMTLIEIVVVASIMAMLCGVVFIRNGVIYDITAKRLDYANSKLYLKADLNRAQVYAITNTVVTSVRFYPAGVCANYTSYRVFEWPTSTNAVPLYDEVVFGKGITCTVNTLCLGTLPYNPPVWTTQVDEIRFKPCSPYVEFRFRNGPFYFSEGTFPSGNIYICLSQESTGVNTINIVAKY